MAKGIVEPDPPPGDAPDASEEEDASSSSTEASSTSLEATSSSSEATEASSTSSEASSSSSFSSEASGASPGEGSGLTILFAMGASSEEDPSEKEDELEDDASKEEDEEEDDALEEEDDEADDPFEEEEDKKEFPAGVGVVRHKNDFKKFVPIKATVVIHIPATVTLILQRKFIITEKGKEFEFTKKTAYRLSKIFIEINDRLVIEDGMKETVFVRSRKEIKKN